MTNDQIPMTNKDTLLAISSFLRGEFFLLELFLSCTTLLRQTLVCDRILPAQLSRQQLHELSPLLTLADVTNPAG